MKKTIVTSVIISALGIAPTVSPSMACEKHDQPTTKNSNSVSYNGIKMTDAWMRPALQNMNTAFYITLYNKKESGDIFLGGVSDVAEKVELHNVKVTDEGTMKMFQIENLPVGSHETVSLKPKSYHIMLIGLKKTLSVGDSVSVKLHFAKAGEVTLSVPVLGDK